MNMFSDFIDVQLKSNPSQKLKLSIIWLRDHCRCQNCFNHTTKQRILDLTQLPKDLRISEIHEKADDQLLVLCKLYFLVTFLKQNFLPGSDGHESYYSFQWLWKAQVQQLSPKTQLKPWTKSSIEKENYAKIDIDDLLNSEEAVKMVVQSLIQYGVAFIRRVPPNTDMTEMVIRR